MDKIIQELIEQMKSAFAADAKKLPVVKSIEDEFKQLGDTEEDAAKKFNILSRLAALYVDVEDVGSTPKETSKTVETLVMLLEIFSAADEAVEKNASHGASGSLFSILNSLIYCADDLTSAIKYLKEMVLLVQLEETKTGISTAEEAEAQAIKDDEEAATAETPMKTEGGKKYPALAYLYVPEPKKPSTWEIRIWETPEKKVTIDQLGRAVVAISKGFRGKKAELPQEEIAKVEDRLYNLYKEQGVGEDKIPQILNSSKGAGVSLEEERVGMDKEILIQIARKLAGILKNNETAVALATEVDTLEKVDELSDEQFARLQAIVTELTGLAKDVDADTPASDDTATTGGNITDPPQTTDTPPADGDTPPVDGDTPPADGDTPVGDGDALAELKATVTQLQTTVTQQGEEISDYKTQLAGYAAKELVAKRMAVLKEKGLDAVFATSDEAKKAEITALAKMTEDEFTQHVALLEAAKLAFAAQTSTASVNTNDDTLPEAIVESIAQELIDDASILQALVIE